MPNEVNLTLEDGNTITIGKLTEEDWQDVKSETGFDVEEYTESIVRDIEGKTDWELSIDFLRPLSPAIRLEILHKAFKKEYPDITREKVSEVTSYGLKGRTSGAIPSEEEIKVLLQIFEDQLNEQLWKKMKSTLTLGTFRL